MKEEGIDVVNSRAWMYICGYQKRWQFIRGIEIIVMGIIMLNITC